MNHRTRWGIIYAVLVLGLILGLWMGHKAVTPDEPDTPVIAKKETAMLQREQIPLTHRLSERGEKSYQPDSEALAEGAIANQRTVTFSSAEAMNRFLEAIKGKGIAVIDSMDAFNTLRIAFLNLDDLAGLLGDDDELGYIYPAYIPGGGGTIQDDAVGFGDLFLEWLGVEGDRSGWGEGLKIAVLDTGIGANSVFNNLIQSLSLIDQPADPGSLNGHGTAVASLIASALGLAPDASLLSLRVADDQGVSDTYLIAKAVMQAVDAGVDLINISIGSQKPSALLQRAMDYAEAAGTLVIASAGNDGFGSVAYPAAYENVVGVGAVDARGDHLDFSNIGMVNLTAPGLALTSAWPQDTVVNFTGTSAAAPIVTGAIAAIMSSHKVTAREALQLLVDYSNDAGAPGHDETYGAGIIDIGRVLAMNDPNYTDIAVAANHFTTNSQGGQIVQVTLQNRGNTALYNVPVKVELPTGSRTISINGLPAGGIKTYDFSIPRTNKPVQVTTTVNISGGGKDANLSNNRRVDVFNPADNP